MIYQRHFSEFDFSDWFEALVADLVRAGAAARDGGLISNVG
jgi:hypothetical protein